MFATKNAATSRTCEKSTRTREKVVDVYRSRRYPVFTMTNTTNRPATMLDVMTHTTPETPMPTTIPDDAPCTDCGEQPRKRTCDRCGVSAMIVDCGHMPQPRSIAASGSVDLCDECASATPRAAWDRLVEECESTDDTTYYAVLFHGAPAIVYGRNEAGGVEAWLTYDEARDRVMLYEPGCSVELPAGATLAGVIENYRTQ